MCKNEKECHERCERCDDYLELENNLQYFMNKFEDTYEELKHSKVVIEGLESYIKDLIISNIKLEIKIENMKGEKDATNNL